MKPNVPVSSIMTRNIIKLNLSDSLTKAETMFRSHKIRHIPVVNGNDIVGMLSYSDLLRVSYVDAEDDTADSVESVVFDMFRISQVMAKNISVISPETTIREAAKILSEKDFHALPICKGDALVGILTSTDLIKYLFNQYSIGE